MAVHYRALGIVIKKQNRGEADQVFTIYTREFGKLKVLGKAIRKIKSKLRGGAELFYLSEIEFIQGKAYKTLTDATLIDKFKGLRKNFKKLAIAYKVSDLSDKLIKSEEADKKIWQLLNETFTKLNNCQLPDANYQLLFYYFLWNLFSLLGYQPELYNCSFCQKKIIPGKIYFSPKEGGVICPICFKRHQQKKISKIGTYQEIDSDTVKILRTIIKKDWNILSRLRIKPSHQKKLKTISKDFLSVVPYFEN